MRLPLPQIPPYVYPDHLREQFDTLPQLPGVYLFYGDQHTMPLYIGKSINIRSRVLAHARARCEARLLRQTRRIEFQVTAGDLGAQLLEAQLIKRLQPLHNRRLRKQRRVYTLRLLSDSQDVVAITALGYDHSDTACFGLFSSRHTAIETLHTLADTHELCHHRLGISGWRTKGPCFRFALKRCRGACCGNETHQAHDVSLRQALERWRITTWPYDGPIGLVESSPTRQHIHVVHQWHYLGSAPTQRQAQRLTAPVLGFDRDMYRILCPAVLNGTYPIVSVACSL